MRYNNGRRGVAAQSCAGPPLSFHPLHGRESHPCCRRRRCDVTNRGPRQAVVYAI